MSDCTVVRQLVVQVDRVEHELACESARRVACRLWHKIYGQAVGYNKFWPSRSLERLGVLPLSESENVKRGLRYLFRSQGCKVSDGHARCTRVVQHVLALTAHEPSSTSGRLW